MSSMVTGVKPRNAVIGCHPLLLTTQRNDPFSARKNLEDHAYTLLVRATAFDNRRYYQMKQLKEWHAERVPGCYLSSRCKSIHKKQRGLRGMAFLAQLLDPRHQRSALVLVPLNMAKAGTQSLQHQLFDVFWTLLYTAASLLFCLLAFQHLSGHFNPVIVGPPKAVLVLERSIAGARR